MVPFSDDFANLSQNNVMKDVKSKGKFSDNCVLDILEIYKVLFASSKTELDKRHKKLCLWVASRAAKWFQDLTF